LSKEFDKGIELQIDLMRVAASVRSDVASILKKLEKELVAKIAGENLTKWSKARVAKQLAETRTAIRDYYAEAAEASLSASDDVARVAATVTTAGLPAAAVLPSEAVLERLASTSVVQGAAQGAWWARQDADLTFRYAQAVRQGIVAAETNQQIVQRVQQVMEISRKNAATLVQTSVATVANDARMAVYDANEDIIKRYRALATLDTNTCLICAPLDGKEWDKNKEPIGHSFPFPVYPKHPNCRCLLLGRVTTGEPGGGRATAGGPVPAKTTFGDWLERQSPAKVDEILGKERADLYKAGKLTLDDLVNGSGKPLKVSELKRKYGV